MKNLLFKSQHFSPVYQKYPCGCYFPSKRTLFFRIPAHSLVRLQAPWHPTSCLHFVLPSRSLAPKCFICCNLLTHAFFMKMIRNCFWASVLLTGQAGTFLPVSQLIARRALISSGFDVCQALRTRVPHCAEEVKEHLALQCCQSSSLPGWERPLHCCTRLPLGAVQLLPWMEQTFVQFDVRKQP